RSSTVCLVSASFGALTTDEALFDWLTWPPSPLLQMRTGVLLFSASFCSADDAASAACSVEASCFEAWTPPSEPWQPHDEPPWSWSTDCLVSASFDAFASDEASFDCVTLPSSPLLRTRTEMFELLGSICFADERAAAPWSVSAFCFAAWTPEPPP